MNFRQTNVTDNANVGIGLADDLMEGIEEMSRFSGIPARKLYYMAQKKMIPVFQVGAKYYARKSEFLACFSAKRGVA